MYYMPDFPVSQDNFCIIFNFSMLPDFPDFPPTTKKQDWNFPVLPDQSL